MPVYNSLLADEDLSHMREPLCTFFHQSFHVLDEIIPDETVEIIPSVSHHDLSTTTTLAASFMLRAKS